MRTDSCSDGDHRDLSLNPPVSQAKGPAANLACPSDRVRFTRPAIPGAPRNLGPKLYGHEQVK